MIAFHTTVTPKGHKASVVLDDLGLSSRLQLPPNASEWLEASGGKRVLTVLSMVIR